MNRIDPIDLPSSPIKTRRPLGRRIMHVIRRAHLYVGLFLFPWAILYGVTGFLFNHPTFVADSPTVSFTREDVAGTPLESAPTPEEQATAIVAGLNSQQKPVSPYQLIAGQAHYATRESFVATVKAENRTFFVVYEPKTASGVIRETTPKVEQAKAPFATGIAEAPRQRGMGMMGPMKHNHAGLKIEDSITDRIKSAVPIIMERKGFPQGEVTVTTAPDIKFPIETNGQQWTAVFNPITTSVSGTPGPEQTELTIRTFLLRLHLSRGYPGEVTTKWIWAVGVDAMAIILCFWGVSGLLMWWQIKATRKSGLVVLALSAISATTLGIAMYGILS